MAMRFRIPYLLAGALVCILVPLTEAHGQALSLDVEAVRVPGVGAGWVTVSLENTYTSPVVACTYNLPSSADPTATVRVRNAGATSFDVRIQQYETSNIVTASDVHCLIADTGAHTLPGGQRIEARTVLSTGTSGNVVGWGSATTENVTASISGFTNMVVLGQVMTFNDARASVFWTNNCVNRSIPPSPAAFCVGKHIGQINATRANETLGYIVAEAGSGTVNDVDYAFARGPNSIRGVGSGPPFTYAVTGDFDTGVATQAAENGGQGGWAVLYGADPLPANTVQLAIDEEVVAGDTTRGHIAEEVYYGLFRNNQTASLAASKSSAVYAGSASNYAIPGSDVIYTIDVASTGTAPVDQDTVFLVDTLPAETEFYNGDIDDAGPETGPVAFQANASGLTFTPATDLRFSSAVARPASFAACTYTPAAGYDASVRHVCLNPRGRLKAGSLEPGTDFSFQLRARIR